MWALVVLFSMAAAFGGFVLSHEARTATTAVLAVDDHLARNMAMYRTMLLEHVRTHPGTTGSVSDADLVFPDWFRRNPAWDNLVQADGTIVVYAAADKVPRSLVIRLAQMSQGSMLTGEARRHADGQTFLHTPWHGDTGIALPALEAGSVVWLARLD